MTRNKTWKLVAGLGISTALACGGGKEETAGVTDAATTAGETTGPAATTDGATTAAPEPTTAAATTEADETGTTAAPETGTTGPVMPAGECDPLQQDCGEGEKCTAVAKNEGTPWDYNKCVPVSGVGVAGDPCDVEGGNKYTGFDNCAEGLLCMLTDQEGLGGVCIEFCDAGMNCPMTGAQCEVYNEGVLPICLPACDPIMQDCPEGQACYQGGSKTFVCFKEVAMPGKGGQGQECKSVNICQGGYHCADAALVPDCTGEGCCTAFCALSEGDGACPPELMCLPFFAEGEAPPDYLDVGVCSIAQ